MKSDSDRKWTVMVYMAGDNNLSDRCIDDLREMKMGLSGAGEVTVKVQVDRSSESGNEAARYTIRGYDRATFLDTDQALEKDKEKDAVRRVNTGSVESLVDFINWCVDARPDDHYMLVLWGHANPLDSGPMPAHALRRPSRRRRRFRRRAQQTRRNEIPFFQICPDDFTQDALTNIELREVLRRVSERIQRPIDILGLDACLMSMIEMSYEVRQYANHIVASQGLVPSTSWPYHWILASIASNPVMSPRNLVHIIVEKFVAYYGEYDDVPVQLSACDLSRCEPIRNVVALLAEQMITKLEEEDPFLRNAILAAHFRAQAYFEENYYDLYDFCYMLRESCGGKYPELNGACNEVMLEINDRKFPHFVIESGFKSGTETDLGFSYGTSIYFPWLPPADNYADLEFAKDSKWSEFLNIYADRIAKEAREDRAPVMITSDAASI